jgi:hypothetical protein
MESFTRLVRLELERHDQTLGSLYSKVQPLHPLLRPSDVREVLASGVQNGLIEEIAGVYRWRGAISCTSMQRWSNLVGDLNDHQHVEPTRRELELRLAIVIRAANDAIGELQAELGVARHAS